MLKAFVITLLIIMSGYYVACSPARFEKDTNCGPNCIFLNGFKNYRYEVSAPKPIADVIVVSDNSASMSSEQINMANRIGHLINILDSHQLDYRVAVITTDLATSKNPPRAVNQNGALQNGQLIQIGGKKFISPSNTPNQADRIALFKNLVQRPETASCEQFIITHPSPFSADYLSQYDRHCPSTDERGIFNVRLAIERNEDGWLRDEGHLAVIVLSDEDVRSGLYDDPTYGNFFPLHEKDRPENLISEVQRRFPQKSFRFHSIIVQPGDHTCKAQQDNQLILGGMPLVSSSFGRLYHQATQATGGIQGTVCANDYASQLVNIANNIVQSTQSITLNCSNPQTIDSQTPLVTFSGTPPSQSYSINGNVMTFTPPLSHNAKAYLQYKCE